MKPVELIIANALHDALSRAEMMPEEWRVGLIDKICAEESAVPFGRMLLKEIADSASDNVILKALAAIGAPATKAAIAQRLQAVRDQRSSHANA